MGRKSFTKYKQNRPRSSRIIASLVGRPLPWPVYLILFSRAADPRRRSTPPSHPGYPDSVAHMLHTFCAKMCPESVRKVWTFVLSPKKAYRLTRWIVWGLHYFVRHLCHKYLFYIYLDPGFNSRRLHHLQRAQLSVIKESCALWLYVEFRCCTHVAQ